MIRPLPSIKYASSSYLALFLVIFLSFVYTLYLLGLDFILGHSAYWANQSSDMSQHLSGINMYLQAAWQYPLLSFNALNYPEGTLVTFIDGIPILSVLLKLFLSKHVSWINPLGYWLGLCFILQGVSAWWIAKELRIDSWIFLLFLLLAFLTFPEFLFRIGHTALMSQWTILFAFALYIRDARRKKYSLCGWSVLLTTAFYIHIYLFVMVFAIHVAGLFFLKKSNINVGAIKLFSPLIIWFVTLLIFFLPLPVVHLHKAGGFGLYSMNLLSPFLGGAIISLPMHVMPCQYEGYNYLGLGVIVLFFTALFINPSMLKKRCQRHLGLLVALLVLWLFSLSNKVYLGQHLVASISYPGFTHFIIEELRSSGRFFWPVGYSIIIFSLYVLHANVRKRTFIKVAVILLCVQLADVSDGCKKLKWLCGQASVNVAEYQADDAWLRKAQHLYYYPEFGCSKLDDSDNVLTLMHYAASHRMTLNTGYIARYVPDCNNVSQKIAASDKAHSAYIFYKAAYPELSNIHAVMGGGDQLICHQLKHLYLCQYTFFEESR